MTILASDRVIENTKKLCRALEAHFSNAHGAALEKMIFSVTEGTKYLKVSQEYAAASAPGTSVHCFIDKVTGDIYKPDTWRSPAKGVRGNIVTELNEILLRCDWVGRYLYTTSLK